MHLHGLVAQNTNGKMSDGKLLVAVCILLWLVLVLAACGGKNEEEMV